MKFRNPWVDPRVEQVRAGAARAYLVQRGWKELPVEQTTLLPFESPTGVEGSIVRVPLREEARDYPQRVIELIGDLALVEDRHAVAVLNEILGQPADAVAGNGAAETATIASSRH